MARKSPTRATSTKSKRPARTTKFSSCRSSGGTPKKISTSPGADTTPLYSPDGKYLAWRSQSRAGFEADKWRLLVQDRQNWRRRAIVTAKLDRLGRKLRLGDRLAAVIILRRKITAGRRFCSLCIIDGTKPNGTCAIGLHADDLAVINYAGNDAVFHSAVDQAPNEIWRCRSN